MRVRERSLVIVCCIINRWCATAAATVAATVAMVRAVRVSVRLCVHAHLKSIYLRK